MVEDAMLEIAVVDLVMVRLAISRWLYMKGAAGTKEVLR
jgi:hypothetical protein